MALLNVRGSRASSGVRHLPKARRRSTTICLERGGEKATDRSSTARSRCVASPLNAARSAHVTARPAPGARAGWTCVVVVETESASPKMCDFEGDSMVTVAVVAVSLKMWDIFEGDAV